MLMLCNHNMGQGGCMAIEDGYQLAWELDNAWEQSIKSGSKIDINLEIQERKKATNCHYSWNG
ncbi:hypothetical protein AAHE18_16G073500 [Arachis hypogaea]